MDSSVGPPGWSPPAPAAAPAPAPRRVPPHRRSLDNRRIGALFIDLLAVGLIPLTLMATGQLVTDGAALVIMVLQLIYFFLCEATTGQTLGKRALGLRVVQTDGSAPTVAQISARTVLRLIDHSILGVLVYVCSGGRRRRIGDFAAGTIVVDADPDPGRPRRTPLLYVYPVAWLAGAFAIFALTGHKDDTYLAELESICREADAALAAAQPITFDRIYEVEGVELAVLERLEVSPDRRAVHGEIVEMKRRIHAEATAARQRMVSDSSPQVAQREQQRLAAAAAPLDARSRELGVPACA